MPVMPRPRTVILSATITSQWPAPSGGKQEADMGKKGNFWKAAVISTKEIEQKNMKKELKTKMSRKIGKISKKKT